MRRHITEQAAQWFLRLRVEADTAAQRAEFEAWYRADPRHAVEYEAIHTLWDDLDSTEGSRRLAAAVSRHRRTVRRRVGAGVAAALALLVLPLAWHGAGWRTAPALAIVSGKGQTIEHRLADGSRVLLGADSAVEAIYTTRERRLRLLRGEVRFEVVPDAAGERPFRVDAGDARATVLGTRFVVALRPQRVEITVEQGRVSTAGSDGGTTLVLGAGEAADLVPGAAPHRVRRDAAEAGAFAAGRIELHGASLAELAQTLSRYRERPVTAPGGDAGPRIDAVIQADAIEAFLGLLPQTAAVEVRETETETRLEPR